ncbi:phosphoglycerate mutase family protein [Cooperia oncophora]
MYQQIDYKNGVSEERFQDIKLDHVFASPFDSTIETASIIVANKDTLVKPEPGLCEVLCNCENPPGFQSTSRLKKKYPLVDQDYEPVYAKETLPEENRGNRSCLRRLRRTLRSITSDYDGDLLIVSHAAPIAAIHEICGFNFTYVGQATVTKFIESEDKIRLVFTADASHLSDKSNLRPY